MIRNSFFEKEVADISKKSTSKVEELFNNLINYGYENEISDIHIEPYLEDYRIRMRKDGELTEYQRIPKTLALALIGRIKVLTELDIGEKRFPQDGRFKGIIDIQLVDFRVSTVPFLRGERCVIRILNQNKKFNLDNLGFSRETYEKIYRCINKKNGLIIITGPTGSGKTTTLYSILNYLNNGDKNILTIEDPVEYEIEGISQSQCKMEIGLDYQKLLRGFLRQDPDVIFIGEIRDKETGEIALRSALTGHLVLTTLHTKNCVSALERLKDLGIDMFLLINGISLIQSQRLVKKKYKDGYKGRIAIEETLEFTDSLREYILDEGNLKYIREKLVDIKFKNLYERGMEKVKNGETTLNEIFKECQC
ncbi:protein transport protein HofB [Cetobacterium ceti]|uniref:Protein transport protein HofB n=1 Tax=Cetobacterium ceti TaxID=180163 RepID=A0A1T4QIX8_9FUSO|nr:GspE/PulE family protein [Cetobacterium ceti]SKA03597.1 protein transport protein HofB [Cetobacterium ceti]